jgi:uncharacterized protein YbjT (DUF2867 family)
MNILVAGASGYIGGKLVPRLQARGYHVICLVRNPEQLSRYNWDNVDIRRGDLLDQASLNPVMHNVDVAYYLVHSMADGVHGFIQRDCTAAGNFAMAAQAAGVKRIIYLGGLGDCNKSLSPHLETRQQVGELLRQSGVPVTEFRAAIVVGSGSMSFEMIRYLTERLPILFTPNWISTLCQPIAIDNVLDYLIGSLDEPRSVDSIFEIGGPDVLTYEAIMRGYASARQLNRRMVRLPFLNTRLLAIGADVVTPLPSPYLHILIDGLKSEVLVNDPHAQEVFNFNLISYSHAIQQALQRDGSGEVETYWAGAKPDATAGRTRKTTEGMFIEQLRLEAAVTPEVVYRVFSSIGGKHGWYYGDWLWQLRGVFDRLAGGPGMRRGRSEAVDLQSGDVVDGYTVETVQAGRLLRLRNNMKAPGPAWMQFEALTTENGKSLYVQTAFFEPHGLVGLIYWYALYPFHQIIFNGLAQAIVRRAKAVNQLR